MSRALRHKLAGSNAPSSDGALWRRRRHVLGRVRAGEDSTAIAAEMMMEHRLVKEIIAGEITRLHRAHCHPEAIAAELHQKLDEVRRVLKPLEKSSPRPKAAPPSPPSPRLRRDGPAPSPAESGGRSEPGASLELIEDRTRGPYGPRLTEAERDEIARLRAQNIRYVEIAERLGRPLATVAAVQHRARQQEASEPPGASDSRGEGGPIETALLTLNGRVRPGPEAGLWWLDDALTDNRGLVRRANQLRRAGGQPPIAYPGV